jgi:hypothetical protein
MAAKKKPLTTFRSSADKVSATHGRDRAESSPSISELEKELFTELKECQHGLSDVVSKRFVFHLCKYLTENDIQLDKEKIHGVYKSFYEDVRQQFDPEAARMQRLVDAHSALADFKTDEHHGEDHTGQTDDEPERPYIQTILDAFGRGILHPLDDYGIIGETDKTDNGAPCFPRCMCGPFLDTVKNYLIGRDKYDATNQRFLASITKYCNTDTRFDKQELNTYFDHDKVKQFLVNYMLFMLDALRDTKKREGFHARFHDAVDQSRRAKDIGFLSKGRIDHFIDIVLQAWGRFCFQHMEGRESHAKANRILQWYVPELY